MHSRLLTAFLFLLAVTARSQTVAYLFVDSSKAASGAGTSWSGAYKTLNEALNVANSGSSSTAYSIFVAKGTYYPTGAQSGTNRDSAFALLRGGLRVYGGYPTGGGARNITANPTVLSGAIGSATDSTDNSYHVVLAVNIPASSDSLVLDGLTVTRGAATGAGNQTYAAYSLARGNGGGISLGAVSKAALRSCRFLNNYTSGQGGGMYLNFCGDTVQIDNVEFQANSATSSGGGICTYLSRLAVTRSSFTGNAASNGGGIYHGQYFLGLRTTTFTGNSARTATGGAVEISGTNTQAAMLYDSLTFASNTAATGGGGLYLGGASATYAARFRACTFTGNATTAGGGGALAYASAAPLILDTCTFTANKTGAGNGGAVRSDSTATAVTLNGDVFTGDSATASGGGALATGKYLTARRCTFATNYGSTYGGAYMSLPMTTSGAQTFTDCTFDGNKTAGNGGGLYPKNCSLTRCRVRGNEAANYGGGIASSGGSLNIDNSLISGNKATYGGAISVTQSQSQAFAFQSTFAGDTATTGRCVYGYSSGTAYLAGCLVWEGATNSMVGNFATGSLLSTSYSSVQGSTTGPGFNSSNSNTLDPLFVAPLPASAAPTTGGNYALTACSPAINTGYGFNLGPIDTIDLIGNPRFSGLGRDKGAYEFQVAPITGTISGLNTGMVSSVIVNVLCVGSTAQLTSSVAGGTWSNPGPVLATVSSTGLLTAGTTDGVDTVLYTVMSGGCPVQTYYVFNVVLLPVLSPIGGGSTLCSNGTSLQIGTPPGGTWSSINPSVATINATTGLMTGVAAGTVTIRYTVTNIYGCTDSISKTLTSVAAPAVAAITPATASLCAGGTLQLSNTTAGGVWSTSCTGGSPLSVSTTGLVTGTGAGACTVYYAVTVSSSSCSTTVSRPVTVYATPVPVITGPATVCSGVPTPYTASPTGTTWSWSVSNATAAAITPVGGVLTGTAAGGATTVTYTYTTGPGCTGTGTRAVTVIPALASSTAANLCSSGPGYTFGTQLLTTAGTYTHTFTAASGCDSVVTLTLTGTPPPDTTVLTSGTASLVAQDTGTTYQWVRCEPNGSQTPLAGETGRIFTAPATGSYAVIVTKAGCSATSNCHAAVLPTAGLVQAAPAGWALYPNPTTGTVTVQTGAAPARTLTVTDATGKRLLQVRPAVTETVLHLEGFAPGLYLVTATDASGASYTLRVTLTAR